MYSRDEQPGRDDLGIHTHAGSWRGILMMCCFTSLCTPGSRYSPISPSRAGSGWRGRRPSWSYSCRMRWTTSPLRPLYVLANSSSARSPSSSSSCCSCCCSEAAGLNSRDYFRNPHTRGWGDPYVIFTCSHAAGEPDGSRSYFCCHCCSGDCASHCRINSMDHLRSPQRTQPQGSI